MVKRGVKIHIPTVVKELEGCSFIWAEDVEVEDPQGWYAYGEAEVEKLPEEKARVKKKKRVKRDAPLKSTPSYPYEIRVGAYLAMKKGPEEMRKLKKDGVTEHHLEEEYMKQRKPGICRNPAIEQSKLFDVEKLEEEAVKALLNRYASGPLTKSRHNPQTGKTEHYIVLLAMTPGKGDQRKVDEEEEEEEEQSDSDSKPRPEVTGLVYKEEGQREERLRKRMVRRMVRKMVRNAKNSEKKRVKAMRDAERPGKRERERRLKQAARRVKQHARQVRKRARQARKKEETPMEPEKKPKSKREKRKGKLVNKEVKKILLRAPLKASGRPKSSCDGRPEKVNGGSNHGWKAGSREIASETAPASQCKKLSTSQVKKLLKEAMKLSKEANASKTGTESLGAVETPSQQTVSPPHEPDQDQPILPVEDFKDLKQDQLLLSETQEANEYGPEDIGPDHSADVPDLSNNAGEGCEYVVGLTPENSESEEEADSSPSETCPEKQQPTIVEQESRQEERVLPEENSNMPKARKEGCSRAEKGKPKVFKGRSKSVPSLTDDSEAEVKTERDSKANVTDTRDEQPNLPKENSNCNEDLRGLVSSSEEERVEVARTRSKKKKRVKRSRAPTPTLTSDSEEEKHEKLGVRKAWLPLNPSPSLTESSDGETPYLADSEEEEARVGETGGQVGSMKGGSGQSYEALLTVAILKSGENVMLDEPTRGDGSCFSHAIVQQSRRRSVGLYLKSRGKIISDFMHLKESVAQFIKTNTKSQKVESLRVNFEVSQLNMHREGRRRRSWREYWSDMQSHGEDEKYWADDTFVQATAWYLNLPIRIIYAGDDTEGRTVATTDADFFHPIDGEQRPLLYLGYIVNQHYQSLLPLVETDYVPPPGLAQPALVNTLQNTLQALLEAKAKQGTEVSSQKEKKTTSSHPTSRNA